MSTTTLPPLRYIPPSTLLSLPPPSPHIKSPTDIAQWRLSRSYTDYTLFLRRLSDSVVSRYLPYDSSLPGCSLSPAIGAVLKLLDTIDGWIVDIPPLDTPQRFGNLAFRTWGAQLEQRADDLLRTLLSDGDFAVTRGEAEAVIAHVKPLFVTSFGSFTRMDYGTGHEASFALMLLALSLVRFFLRPRAQHGAAPQQGAPQQQGAQQEQQAPQAPQEEETQLALIVFPRYLLLTWHLQDTYRLEPAGSHGVWGLDDSSFLGYIFGSAQLRDQTTIPVSSILPTPTRTQTQTQAQGRLPPTNLYFQHINRIHQVKHGPFHEHSAQLHAIATGVPSWGKVFAGLCKMYEAEVLGKKVVVQHIPLGGVLEWDPPSQSGVPPSASTSTSPSPTQSASTSTNPPPSSSRYTSTSTGSTSTRVPARPTT